jgi:superfamily II DNA or RNA helicase
LRWENTKSGKAGYAPACSNEWVKGVCNKPQIKCGECPNQAFIPVTGDTIESHLRGKDRTSRHHGNFVAGVYPLLPTNTCWFLAADFDGEKWAEDAIAFVQTCRANNIPAALERSRSGQGGHVWIFFSELVPGRIARQLGSHLLTETMDRRPEIGFKSYDRLFPSQDTMPLGGFGNLIALPLQRKAREQGNSVFVDDGLKEFEDQWAFLQSVRRMSLNEVEALVDKAETRGRVLGVRMPVDDEDAERPWQTLPSRRSGPPPISEPLPSETAVVLANEIYIDRRALPPSVVARLVRLAAFQNPEFYRAQAMRLPTFGKPRIISCAEIHPNHIALPRGCLDEATAMLQALGIGICLDDRRESGVEISAQFLGTLHEQQMTALHAIAPYDFGVLSATTAFGKTVIAAAMIAERRRSTLVLVHRRELLEQWTERLKSFLAIDDTGIGVIGGGRRRPTGRIDVALIQSLVRKGEVSDIIAGYGQLIVDECHHLSAPSFELVARRSKARYVLGLSATVARKDGHHPIIFMQCGPLRHLVSAKSQAARRGFAHCVRVRETGFQLPAGMNIERPSMPAVYAALAHDEARNNLIFDDVLTALDAGRCPLVLTERRDHLEMLETRFRKFTRNLVVLRGAMRASERLAANTALKSSSYGERLILATGRYLGEGFDDSRLDTLFLTMPISWKGTLAQYVGRLHRDHESKREVIVYDYVDTAVPILTRMAARRRSGYRALGYVLC